MKYKFFYGRCKLLLLCCMWKSCPHMIAALVCCYGMGMRGRLACVPKDWACVQGWKDGRRVPASLVGGKAGMWCGQRMGGVTQGAGRQTHRAACRWLSSPLPGSPCRLREVLWLLWEDRLGSSCPSLSVLKTHRDSYWLHTWSFVCLSSAFRSSTWLHSPVYVNSGHQLSRLWGFQLRTDTNGTWSAWSSSSCFL